MTSYSGVPLVGHEVVDRPGEVRPLLADRADGHEVERRRTVAGEVGREDAQAHLVLVVELVERLDRSLLGEVELGLEPVLGRGIAHRAGDVDHEQHARRLPLLVPLVEDADRDLRVGHLEQRLRLVRVDAVRRGDRVGDRDRRVAGPEAELQHLRLVVGLRDEVAEAARAPCFCSSVTHGAFEDEETGCRRRACPSFG